MYGPHHTRLDGKRHESVNTGTRATSQVRKEAHGMPPRGAHLNWREAPQMGHPQSLRALPYALVPSLMRDLQAIGERWHVHVLVPRGTIRGIKMLGI